MDQLATPGTVALSGGGDNQEQTESLNDVQMEVSEDD